MNLIGRWEKVRPYGPDGWGMPFMLDRKWGKVGAYNHPEWWKSPEDIYYPVVAGGLGLKGSRQPIESRLGVIADVLPTATNTSINSSYVAGSTGAAIGCRFRLPEAMTLSKIYFFISSFTGTAANVNDMEAEVRTGTGITPGTTGGDLIANSSGSVNPSSTTGWTAVTGLSASLSAATRYWAIIRDADGSGTDFAILRRFMNPLAMGANYIKFMASTTTNGFSTITRNAEICTMVLVGNGGEVWGSPFDAAAAVTSNTVEKGLHIDGLNASVKIFGMSQAAAVSGISGARIWEGTDGPGGSPWKSTTDVMSTSSTGTGVLGVMFAEIITLAASQPYRFTFTFGTSAGQPTKLSISTTGNSELRAAMPGGGGWVYTIDGGGGSWTDDLDGFPIQALWLEDLVAPDTGGGALVGSNNLVS